MDFKVIWQNLKEWIKKYFFFLIVTAASVIFSFLAFRKSYSSEIKVNNFKSILTNISKSKNDTLVYIDSLKWLIIDQKIQQETYTEMLDRQSDWFIMYVTILFAILSIFGFVVSTKTVSDIKRKNSKENKRLKEIHDDFIKEFKELKIDVYKGMTNISWLNIKTLEKGKLEDVIPELIDVFGYYDKSLSLGLNEEEMINVLPEAFKTLLIGLKKPEFKEELRIIFTKNDFKNLHNFIKHIEGIGAKTNKEIKYIGMELITTVVDITKTNNPV